MQLQLDNWIAINIFGRLYVQNSNKLTIKGEKL